MRRQHGCCFRCGQPGHIARLCTTNIWCQACGQRGHMAVNCRVVRCYQCGHFGHIAKNCLQSQRPIPTNARPQQSYGPTPGMAIPPFNQRPPSYSIRPSVYHPGPTAQNPRPSSSNNSQVVTPQRRQEHGVFPAFNSHATTPASSFTKPQTSQGSQGQGQTHPSPRAATTSVRPSASRGQQPAGTQTQVHMTMRQCVQTWYPDLLKRAHFMPPVYMNRVLHEKVVMSGVEVAIPQPTGASLQNHVLWETDVQDDRAQQHVLHCLKKLAQTQGDVMFVLSQMQFGDYLGEPCYAPACKGFRVPADLKNQSLDRGDFDVLIIHREYGLLVGEIKCVGRSATARSLTEDDFDQEVLIKLRKMMNLDKAPKKAGQLEKAKKVLRHVLGDLSASPRVQATLILPYVTSSQLRRALFKDNDVKQNLCKDLDIALTDDPVDACLCSDLMSDSNSPHDVTDTVIQSLGQWWSRRMSGAGSDKNMTDDLYETLVTRFAGPASIVRIHCQTEPRLQITPLRTEGEYVGEAGARTAPNLIDKGDGTSGNTLTTIALYPDQVAAINAADDMVYLVGPPGTGKTLMLVIAALGWLQLGLAVYVLILDETSTAVGLFIRQQIRETARQILGEGAAKRVDFFKTSKLWRAKNSDQKAAALKDLVKDLAAVAKDGQLCLIADEATNVKELLEDLCKGLLKSVTRLRLWAASYKPAYRPACLNLHQLTDPLRCPPCVKREVDKAMLIQNKEVPSYTVPLAPPPTDGPPVIRIRHEGPKHTGDEPSDCAQCGREVGHVLLDQLHVGQGGVDPSGSVTRPALRYRDVLILTMDVRVQDETNEDDNGHVTYTPPVCDVIVGLRQAGVPLRVVRPEDPQSVGEIGLQLGPDKVVVTHVDNVKGLERKVIVWLGQEGMDDGPGCLSAASRCVSQLIWVLDSSSPPPDTK